MTRLAIAGVLLLGVLMPAPSASAQTPTATSVLRGLGVDEPLAGPAILAPALDRLGNGADTRPAAFVRLILSWSDVQDLIASGNWQRFDARLLEYARRTVPVLLSVADSPVRESDGEAFATAMRAVASHARGRIAAYQFDVANRDFDPAAAAFVLKLAAVQVRAADPRAWTVQMSVAADDTARQSSLYARDVAPYVDIAAFGSNGRDAALSPTLTAIVQSADPSATTMVTGVPLDAVPAAAAAKWVKTALAELAGRSRTATFTGSADVIEAVLTAENQLRDLFSADVVALDDASVALALTTTAGDRVAVGHQLFYNLSTLSTYLACWDTPESDVRVSLQDALGRRPTLRDPIDRVTMPLVFAYEASTKVLSFSIPRAGHARVIDLNYGAAQVYVARAEVGAVAALSVAEVISREQQTRAVQTARFRSYIANARMEMHFRPTSTDAFQVVTENRFFADAGAVEWDELSFSVNGTKWGPDRPAFPLLQAEKVLSLPLDLQFTTDYSYRLDGMATIDGRRSYVVTFEPIRSSPTLYAGRVWIDAETFQRLRINTIQARGKAPVISSEETIDFAQVADPARGPVFLPVHVTTKQIWLVAGQNLLVEKEVRYSAFEIEPQDFGMRRAAAHASDHVMFRDTDQGLRYLARQGTGRVVSDRVTMSSKAMAMGATIDPSYSYPLPMFGIDYLNFAFPGPDSQLALLFAGVLALGNIQTPHLGTLPLDASVDFFGIAVPSNDIVVDAGGERKAERVLNIPGNIGANIGWQFTPFQKLKANYQFHYDFYFHDTTTDPDLILPRNTLTHGIGAGYEYKRRGYLVNVTGGAYHRTSSAPWGEPDALVAPRPDYRRYAATVAKDFFITTFQTLHVGAGWYGGRNLDRFSMYQFGLFDEVRMHGVPSAGIKMRDLTLLRGSYSFNVFEQYRLDLFLDQAFGSLLGDEARRRSITGTGVAVNFKAPWNTMFKVDVGKSFLPAPVAKSGSVVLQFLVLKPL
ncbi:MAG: hypothetical protein ABI634_14820 [Acidobacteriota bacterium]